MAASVDEQGVCLSRCWRHLPRSRSADRTWRQSCGPAVGRNHLARLRHFYPGYHRSGAQPCGHDYRRAVQYLGLAAENASRRCAPVEAIRHLQKALGLVPLLPDTQERAHQELSLLTLLGGPLIATKGYAAPDVEATFARARPLPTVRGNPAALRGAPRVVGLLSRPRPFAAGARTR